MADTLATLQITNGTDAGNSRATARPIALDAVITDTFDSVADLDYYTLSLQPGTTYTVTPTWHPRDESVSKANIRLYDAAGRFYGGASGPWSFTTIGGGEYFLLFDASDGGAADYTFTISAVRDDFGASAQSAGRLSIDGAAVGARLEVSEDRDWFAVSMTAGVTYRVLVGNDMRDIEPQLTSKTGIAVVASDGRYVATRAATFDDNGTQVRMLEYTPTISGTYHVEVFSGLNGGGTYHVRAVTIPADDHGDTPGSATVIAPDAPRTGQVRSATDLDVFKLAMTAGQTYVVEVAAQNATGGATLALSGAGVAVVSSSFSAAGLAAYQVLTATASGDYYFTLANGAQAGASDYTIKVRTPADDHGPGPYAKSTLAVGSKVSGKLDYAGDADAFLLKLEAGVRYAFQLRGQGSGEGSLATEHAILTLKPASGGTTPTAFVAKGSGAYSFNATTSGDVHIEVRQPDGALLPSSGSYTLYAFATTGTGTAGNDYLSGSGYTAKLAGGAGIDTAIYVGASSQYRITLGEDGARVAGGAVVGGDSLTSVERLAFSNTNIALDIAGNGGQAYRLYRAAFDRTPDNAGLGYWIAQMDQGATLSSVADGFIGSAEFIALNGQALGNDIFISKLYDNVLHRAPEAAGYDYWLGALASGASRADVLAAFSESAENQAAVAKVIGNGFDYTFFG